MTEFGYRPVQRILKRAFDLVVAGGVMIVGLPLFAALTVWLRWQQGAPVFFFQERIGRGGRRFRMVKLRTMTRHVGIGVTARDDPRITRWGAVYRRYRLDEWPEFLHVFTGRMSLVGPRPELPRFVDRYSKPAHRLLTLQPGLTDPATLEGLDEEDALASSSTPERTYIEELMPAKLERSLAYYRRPSFWGDVSILMRTVGALLVR